MWSFFTRDPTKDFNYEIGERVSGLDDKSIWSLHEGKRRSDGEQVSIFVFDAKNGSESTLNVAKQSFKRIKTLRHPNILTYLDGLETEKVLYIVTEVVIPLETYLTLHKDDGSENEVAISWGLHQIAKGLSFLINDCKFIHNNVCISSVMVDRAGEWKLAGVDYIQTAQSNEPIPPKPPALDKYKPPETSNPRTVPSEKWSADMWGLGCLIWEVFNGTLPRTASLKQMGTIPKKLVPNYCELVGANPKSRPNPSKFLEDCCRPGRFLNNDFIKTMLFLEEIQIKDQNEKMKFFSSLPKSLDTFPQTFCKHKILPQLLNAFEYGNAGSAVLTPLFKIGKYLETDEYQKKIVPCVVKLFSSPDRATRVKLLQQVEHFVEHLDIATVNNQIFPHVVQGFLDTNPVVREHTIKAMMHLASKLNHKNLNEELMKHFARLQAKDDQGGIRTNTTVCLGKIATYLYPQNRSKILISAFTRAIRDPFPPARQAGVLAMAATHNLYTLQDCASKLLPALCCLSMDLDKGVRDQVFRTIKCFLSKLEKVSEQPELVQEMEKDVEIGGTSADNATGWAGWAMGGMTSLTTKLYSKTKRPSPSKKVEPVADESAKSTSSQETTPIPLSKLPDVVTEETPVDDNDADTGWDDEDWGEMDDIDEQQDKGDSMGVQADTGWDEGGWNDDDNWESLEATNQGNAKIATNDGWDDGDFISPNSDAQPASSYDWGDTGNDDFFNLIEKPSPNKTKSLMSSKSKSPPRTSAPSKLSTTTNTQSMSSTTTTSSKLKMTAGWEESGWGDSEWKDANSEWKDADSGWKDADHSEWKDAEDWQPIDNTGPTKAELARLKREERKLQRQKEIEQKRAAKQGGAMKLGAKKKPATTADDFDNFDNW
ncbi:N-terminal kinase-like protein [Tubulanus polymorphus]|uniref:N-terminal kinase-like protein n=1 Tax=Tubulanus polymorphus TaxID=672921 RepID=UPI003DA537DD